MVYATLADVEAKWPLTSAAAIARATALLEEAQALLDTELRSLADDIARGAVSPILARKVVTDAVIRVLANPAGVSGQTLGPEAVQFTGVRTLGTVAFTPAELASLEPSDAAGSVGGMAIGSVGLRIPAALERELHPYRRPAGWC